MILQLDELVEISPKLLLFNVFSKFIDEEMVINFLKNDILLLEDKNMECNRCKDALAYIYNLDEFSLNTINDEKFKENLIEQIKKQNNMRLKNFFISSGSEDKIKDLANNYGIISFAKNENSKDEIINIIKEIIINVREKREFRTSLRLHFKPKIFKAEIKSNDISCDCYMTDLSYTGIGLELKDNSADVFRKIQVGAYFSICIDFHMTYLDIMRGVVTRKDQKKNLIGIKINVSDKFEINDENTKILESIFTTWLKKIVKSNQLIYSNT